MSRADLPRGRSAALAAGDARRGARLSWQGRPDGDRPPSPSAGASGRAPSATAAASEASARRIAVALGALLSVLVLGLDWTYHRHAGPLWRDEVNSVNVAEQPSLREAYATMHRDSFPAAWITVLYGWKAAGLGDTDAALRRLGLVVGAALVGVLWWTAWRLGSGPPLVALLLFGMSPTTVVYGTEVRGYGLAAVALAWCLGAMWALVREATPWRVLLALVATVAAAQTHYLNCVLLLGIGGAAAVVCARRRDVRALAALAAIGLAAAASLVAANLTALRYMTGTTPLEQGDWGILFRVRVFAEALSAGVPALAALWVVAPVAAAAGLVLAWRSPRSPHDAERALFVALVAASAPVLAILAIAQGGVPSQAWYYPSVVVLVAVACDVGIAAVARRLAAGEWIRLAVVAVGALLVWPGASRAVAVRMTNLDVVARTIASRAAPDDLVVVFPWVCGITFQRYYDGRAPWITLPDFDEHRFHLHALVAEKMKLGESAIAPELARIEQTLRRGNAVWIVGRLVAPDPGHSPPPLPPAPDGPRGWRAAPYLDTWELRLGELVETHVRRGEHVPVLDRDPGVAINPWEKLPLMRVEGWR